MAKPRRSDPATKETTALRFTRVNALLGVAGIACVTVGYWLLAEGSIVAAPLLLVAAYVVLLPLAIIL